MTSPAPRSPRTLPRRWLWLAIGASVIIHTFVYLVFGVTFWRAPEPAARGTVSVDFIESVIHGNGADEAPASASASAPAKRRVKPSPVDPTRPGPSSPDAAPPAGEPAQTGSAGGAGGAAGVGASALHAFVTEVARLIDARKSYPRAALRRELEGRVIVAITLGADGTLLRAEEETPSPYAPLNDAALAAVRGVEKFPALPPDSGPTLHLHVPIVFKLAR